MITMKEGDINERGYLTEKTEKNNLVCCFCKTRVKKVPPSREGLFTLISTV